MTERAELFGITYIDQCRRWCLSGLGVGNQLDGDAESLLSKDTLVVGVGEDPNLSVEFKSGRGRAMVVSK